jgi:ArsR family transcriptional regulator, arsenate/arsenite/antimonite-responsive transcriptional repressor
MTLSKANLQDNLNLGFHALSDSIRLQVLDLLRTRELCVCEITEILDIPQSKLSFHLKTLREANLVNSRQQGRWTYYSLNLSQLVILEQYLAEFRRSSILSPPTRICCDN